MSIIDIFDATATRCRTLVGLKECYTVTGTLQDDGTLLAIPTSLDDSPVGALMPRGGDIGAGNAENFVHRFELQIWQNAADTNPLASMAFVERCRVMFRSDMDANGTATRLLFSGYEPLRTEEINSGQVFLVLPIRFEVLELHFSHDYSV